MSWICDRCKKPDLMLKPGERPSITISISITDFLKTNEDYTNVSNSEVCNDCFRHMKKAWNDFSTKEEKQDDPPL